MSVFFLLSITHEILSEISYFLNVFIFFNFCLPFGSTFTKLLPNCCETMSLIYTERCSCRLSFQVCSLVPEMIILILDYNILRCIIFSSGRSFFWKTFVQSFPKFVELVYREHYQYPVSWKTLHSFLLCANLSARTTPDKFFDLRPNRKWVQSFFTFGTIFSSFVFPYL